MPDAIAIVPATAARVSYAIAYYDDANRLTYTVGVEAAGGAVSMRPDGSISVVSQ